MFDWRLYQNNQLIEEYLSLEIINNNYKVSDYLNYDHEKRLLVKESDDSIINIDLLNNKITIALKDNNFNGEIDLYKSEVIDNNSEISITYQISEDEPLNKVVISRRNI